MFCSNCGAQLNEGGNFCTKCGARINIPVEVNDRSNDSNVTFNNVSVDVVKIAYENKLFSKSSGLVDTCKAIKNAVGSGSSIKEITDIVLKLRKDEVFKEKVEQYGVEHDDKLRCPKCFSEQIHYDKKGYSVLKGVAGAVATGGIGLLAGFHGNNNLFAKCLRCGHKWNIK